MIVEEGCSRRRHPFFFWLSVVFGLAGWVRWMNSHASWLLASCLKAWFRPAGRVTFSKRRKSNQKRFAPASGPALRSGFVHYAAAPRVAVQGPSMALYRGTPSSLAASLRLAPLRDGFVHPLEGAVGVAWWPVQDEQMDRFTRRSDVHLWLQSSTFICAGSPLVLASRARTSLRHAQAGAWQ